MADFMEKLKELNNTKDSTAQMDPQDMEKNRFMAVLSYISLLVLIPIFCAKDSAFAKFHANQGLTLAIVEIIAWIVLGILKKIPILGILFTIVDVVLSLVFFVIAVIGILNACNGKAKELPLIGKFQFLK